MNRPTHSPLCFQAKQLTLNSLPAWRQSIRDQGKRLVATNGCFDILHLGHATYLQEARNLGDALLVGLNSDHSVSSIKGPSRPVNPEADRAGLLAALEAVSAVLIFQEPTATKFLLAASPDIYVKGGDYTLDTLNPDERLAVESSGGQIAIIPFLPGRSTSALLTKISQL